jgi:hypothetical protein
LPDARQDGLLIAREGPVIGAVELDEAGLCDVAGEMPAGADANGVVAATVQHQGRNGNSRQKMPHIGVAQCLEHAFDGARPRRRPQHAGPPGSRPRIARQARQVVAIEAAGVPTGYAAVGAQHLGMTGTETILLGRMSARIDSRPCPGDRCAIAAWPTGRDGRKLFADSALLSSDGRVLAGARATWLLVDRQVHLGERKSVSHRSA